MFASTLNPFSNASRRAPPRPPRRPLSPSEIRDEGAPFLRYHPLVDPLPAGEVRHLPAAGVWISGDDAPYADPQQLFERHLTLQSLLLHLEALGERTARQANPRLARLLGDSITHVYATSGDFILLRNHVGLPDNGLVAFVDEPRDRFVLDADKGFTHDMPQKPTPALIVAVVRLAEAPQVMLNDADAEVLETARKLARRVLGEGGITFTEPARQLAAKLGTRDLIRWLLSGTPPEAGVVAPLQAV
jgi:hypothetical protein